MYKRNSTKKKIYIDICQFRDPQLRDKYFKDTAKIVVPGELSVQQKLDIVVSKCKEIGKSVLGIFKPNSRNKDKLLADLSNKKRKLCGDIESGGTKHSLTNELRETRKEIRSRDK